MVHILHYVYIIIGGVQVIRQPTLDNIWYCSSLRVVLPSLHMAFITTIQVTSHRFHMQEFWWIIKR